MRNKPYNECWECGRERQRCRAATVEGGIIRWVCRKCWEDLEYDKYLYEYTLQGEQNAQ